MGVFSRLNEQQKKQTEAENAMPGAYENRYDEGIQNALENMNRQNTAGTGFDGSNVDYRGALSRLFGNAGAGADAAAQTANQLSGGYGASWAQSAADQSAASRAQAGAPGTLAKARADALTQWQQELAGQINWSGANTTAAWPMHRTGATTSTAARSRQGRRRTTC